MSLTLSQEDNPLSFPRLIKSVITMDITLDFFEGVPKNDPSGQPKTEK